MQQKQSATSLQISPEDERRIRIRKYSIAMTIRFACVILGVVVQGPLMWLFWLGAIFLPYFAVVIANAKDSSQDKTLTLAQAPTLKIDASDFQFKSESKG